METTDSRTSNERSMRRNLGPASSSRKVQPAFTTTRRRSRAKPRPMLFVVIGSSAGKSREAVMAVYPRHKVFADAFIARGEVVGMGPFIDPAGGNLAIFRTREAAEAFAKGDPFLLEGLVKDYQVKEWGDAMLK